MYPTPITLGMSYGDDDRALLKIPCMGCQKIHSSPYISTINIIHIDLHTLNSQYTEATVKSMSSVHVSDR